MGRSDERPGEDGNAYLVFIIKIRQFESQTKSMMESQSAWLLTLNVYAYELYPIAIEAHGASFWQIAVWLRSAMQALRQAGKTCEYGYDEVLLSSTTVT